MHITQLKHQLLSGSSVIICVSPFSLELMKTGPWAEVQEYEKGKVNLSKLGGKANSGPLPQEAGCCLPSARRNRLGKDAVHAGSFYLLIWVFTL
jgi:hypothetical protein